METRRRSHNNWIQINKKRCRSLSVPLINIMVAYADAWLGNGSGSDVTKGRRIAIAA
uniref:Uncharacterized protein n=1 Tax=Physcomitrium patens TaxID=3218 RepID=A0A2K1IEN7_PHYPA|nr:hypothetical protein PHYPA_029885 [Physcomitrium patens]